MPTFEFQHTDGRKFELEAENAQQAASAFQNAMGATQAPPEPVADIPAADGAEPSFMETQASGVRDIARGVGETFDVVANPVNYLIDAIAGTELGQRPFERAFESGLTGLGVPETPRGDDAVANIIRFVSSLPAGGGIATALSKGLPKVIGAAPQTISQIIGQAATKQAPITVGEVAAAGGAGAGLTAGQQMVEDVDSPVAKVAVPLISSILGALGMGGGVGLGTGLKYDLPGAPKVLKTAGTQTVKGAQALFGMGDIPTSQVGVDITDEFKRVLALPKETPDADIAKIVADRVSQKADELRLSGLSDVEISEVLNVKSVFPELEGSGLFRTMEGTDPLAARQKHEADLMAAEARGEALPEGDDTLARAFLEEELGKERAGIEKAAVEAETAAQEAEKALVGGRADVWAEKSGQALTAEIETGKKLKQADVSDAYDEALGAAKDLAFETAPLKSRMAAVVEEMGMTDMPTLKAAIDKVETLGDFEGVQKLSQFEQAVNNVNTKDMTDNEKRVWMLAKKEIRGNLDDMAGGKIAQETGEAVAIPEMVKSLEEAKTLAAEKGATFKAQGAGAKKTAITPAGQIAKGKVQPEKVADAFVTGGVEDARNFRAATAQLDDVGKKRAETALKDGLVNKFFDELGNWKDSKTSQKNFVKWYKQNRPALKELGPDFDKQFSTPAAAIEALKKAQTDKVAYDKTLRNKILTDVLDTNLGWEAFRKTAGKDILKETRKALIAIKGSDNPEAIKKSLQASYGEYLGNKYSTPDQVIKLLDGVTSDVKLERQVMEKMMRPKQIAALKKFAAVAKEAENIKVSRGDSPQKAATEEIASLSKTLIGNIWLAFMGATIMSPKTAVTRGVYRGAKGKSSILQTQNMKEIMGRAFADPDYLVDLLRKTSPKKAEKDMKVYLWMARDRSKDEDNE